LLYTFAQSEHLRKQRIAIVTTWTFLKHNQPQDTIAISKILLNHPHDLIHKAVGWMLREMGKLIDRQLLIDFLDQHANLMPSVMRSYATEHLAIHERKKYKKK
jgi:3-methyladenine DNA glycosylase AlkD